MTYEKLWNEIQKFEFDSPKENYSFFTRLKDENLWTSNFAKEAIIEYKKFMYLATISNQMVAPSKIVDIVWHQHLIYTESYKIFCKILQKEIKHIPSNHNRDDFKTFEKAENFTKEVYESEFGNQPIEIWKFNSMFESLDLENHNQSINKIIKNSIYYGLVTAGLSYWCFYQIFIKIIGADFIPIYIFSFLSILFIIYLNNNFHFKKALLKINSNKILSKLDAFELTFMENRNPDILLNTIVNNLIKKDYLRITDNKKLRKSFFDKTNNKYENLILDKLADDEELEYNHLHLKCFHEPLIQSVIKTIKNLKENYYNTKLFFNTFIIPLYLIAFVLFFGYSRAITGVLNNKPSEFIFIICVISTIISVIILNRYLNYFYNIAIPNHYKENRRSLINYSWEWGFFLVGSLTFASGLGEIFNHYNRENNSIFGSCGTSCGSSCGSGGSCGGGCGGCGGGD